MAAVSTSEVTDDTTSSTARRFRLDIQGMRAVAVLLVIAAHAKVRHLQGGYIGVDVFFVISGYVITGLLIRQGDASFRSKFTNFYARRMRRILPASTLTLLVTLAATYYWLGPYTGRSLDTDERWASLFAVNFHFISVGTNYLQSTQPPSVILNFWSLAVEEQFYFIYPILLFSVVALIALRFQKRALVGILAVVVIGSALWSWHETGYDPVNAYYSPFTRFWELGLGGFVALLPLPKRGLGPGIRATISWGALLAIVASAFVLTNATVYPGVAAWWPVGATALVLWMGSEPMKLGPGLILERRAIVFIGAISYSLYLWHYPILMIPQQYSYSGSLSASTRIELVVLSFAVATVSYYLIENPIRRSAFLDQRRWLAFVLAAALIASIWIATTVAIHVSPV